MTVFVVCGRECEAEEMGQPQMVEHSRYSI